MPKKQEMSSVMPLLWSAEAQACLPPDARTLLAAQREKLDEDWEILKGSMQGISKEMFTYTWLIVNTRTCKSLPFYPYLHVIYIIYFPSSRHLTKHAHP